MTYIDMINRFWNMDIEYHFTASETRLYFKLMEIANRVGWKVSVSVPNIRLASDVGISEKHLISIRQRLHDVKLIVCIKGNTRTACKYIVDPDNFKVDSLPNTDKKVSNKEADKIDSLPKTYTEVSNQVSNQVNIYKTRPEEIREEKTLASPLLDEKDSKRGEAHMSAEPEKESFPAKPNRPPTPYQDIYEMFISICSTLPQIQEPTKWAKSRRDCVSARWREHPDIGFFYDLFHRVNNSDFLSGRAKSFKAGFDWIFKPANLQKILEGNYDNRDNSAQKFAGLKAFWEEAQAEEAMKDAAK